MEQLYQTETAVLPSQGDATGRLGYDRAVSLFMDLASVHAEMLGSGVQSMLERQLFWLTVKTQARFFRRPRLGETVTLRTWPEAPGKVRCNRSYQVVQQGAVLIAAKTEWAVLDLRTQGIHPLNDIYPPELGFELPTACPGPFAAIPDDFAPEDVFGEYRVRSTDIDLGGHMNNAAYLRALLGCFSNAELAELDIKRIDLSFRTPCFEGELLQMSRRRSEQGLDLRLAREGRTVLLARLA